MLDVPHVIMKQAAIFFVGLGGPDGDLAEGRGRFTTALELKEASQLTLSLLYHMASQRMVKNPLEEDNIVGITNYLDLGLQVSHC